MKIKLFKTYLKIFTLTSLLCFSFVVTPQEVTAQTKSTLDVLDLKNMDVMDVLKLISQKSGINIVASQNVKGRVTVYLKNVDVMEALGIIVEAYNWAYARDGEIIKVMTAQEFEARYDTKFGQESQTRILKLVYSSVADLVAVLNQVKSNGGKVISDEKSSTLILIDNPEKLDEMESIVKRIDVPTITEVFELSYAKAEEISSKITEVLTVGVGQMKYDERTNTIMVSDTPVKLREVQEILDAFDQKDREVLIEAKIIQVTLSDDYKLGVDWEGIVEDYNMLNLKSDFDVLTDSDKRGSVSIGTLSDDQYTATIEALDIVGLTEILSSPSITTINNKEAKILVGSTEPYVTSTTVTPATGSTTTSETVNFIEVGVKLFVTPTIHKDDFVTMKIKPEVSSVVDTLSTGSNNTIPVVGTSEAETTVSVKNGVTIVIGGLIEEQTRRTTKKIPLLGDIPFLGSAFKSESDSVSKQEIVIFLKPTIITGDVDVAIEQEG